MNRLVSLIAASSMATSTLAASPIPLTFPAPPNGHVVPSNFLGMSMELSFLNVFFGNDTNSIPKPILNYLGALRNYTGALPVRLRLGGNSMDDSTFVQSVPGSSYMALTDPNASHDSNDIPVNFTSALWQQMDAVATAIGGGEYVVGLSLVDPSDPRAGDIPQMTNSAKETLGDRLDTFLLGNEPDMYTTHKKRPNVANYTAQIYMSNFAEAAQGLGSNVTSPAILGGPTICCAWDLDDLISEGYLTNFTNELKYVSLQHYPQNNCPWLGPPIYKIDYYAEHAQIVNLATWQNSGIRTALHANKQVIMSEFNTASCGGIPGISDTFVAGSLWTLDYALQLAAVGYSAAYVHQREPGISYNMFQAPLPAGVPGSWVTGPGWYALLIAPQVLGGSNGTRIVDLNVDGSMSDNNAMSAGYAAYDVATGAIARLALFNYNNVTAQGNANQTFTIPADVFKNATAAKMPNVDTSKVLVKYLTAPQLSEGYDISWAGQTYLKTVDGSPVAANNGRPGTVTLDCTNGCSVDVPGPGMALVFISPDSVQTLVTTNGSSTNGPSGTSSTSPSGTGTGKNGAAAVRRPAALFAALVSVVLAFAAFA